MRTGTSGPYIWPKRKRRWADLLYRYRRWCRTQDCIRYQRHKPEDQGVLGVDGSRLMWCRACSSIEWID